MKVQFILIMVDGLNLNRDMVLLGLAKMFYIGINALRFSWC
jgi:hypothetical protein